MDDEIQRQRAGGENNQHIGGNLGEHNLAGTHRHHQQMLDGAALAFADNRGSGKNHRHQRSIADDLRHRHKPFGFQIGIEQDIDLRLERQHRRRIIFQIFGVFAADDFLQIAGARAGLRHSGGIDQQLHLRPAAGKQVGSIVWRKRQDKGVASGIHRAVDLRLVDVFHAFKLRRQQRIADAVGKRAAVLVVHGNGGVFHLGGDVFRRGINAGRKHKHHQRQQRIVAQKAADFLGGEVENIVQQAHVRTPVFSRAAQPGADSPGKTPAARRKSDKRRARAALW